jgi:hypothetical protein
MILGCTVPVARKLVFCLEGKGGRGFGRQNENQGGLTSDRRTNGYCVFEFPDLEVRTRGVLGMR